MFRINITHIYKETSRLTFIRLIVTLLSIIHHFILLFIMDEYGYQFNLALIWRCDPAPNKCSPRWLIQSKYLTRRKLKSSTSS